MLNDKENNSKKFFEYPFVSDNPLLLSNKLIEIFVERNLSDYTFETIKLIHHHLLNTLVPTSLFEPENARNFLDKNVKLLDNDGLNYDMLETPEVTNIYVPYDREIKFLSAKAVRLISRHSASILLNKIFLERKDRLQLPVFEIYLNIFPEDFQIVVFKNEKLQLYNAFPYENTDEFLYYLFFVWETLDITEDKTHIYLSGIDSNNEIVKNLSDFITNYTVIPALTPSSINNYITG